MSAFMDGVLHALEDPKTLAAVAGGAIATGGLWLAWLKHQRDGKQAEHAETHARAAISEALRRKQAERESLLLDKERGWLDIENRRIRVHGQFRRDCAADTVKMAGQGVQIDHKAIEAGPAGLTRARAEDALNLERVAHEHNYKQRLSAVDTDIEILKDKLAIGRSRASS
jgi:hypothetical protein